MSEDSELNIKDSVIQGDITHIANKIDADLRVTCESCHASGNFTIFTCNSTNCTNKFCEHCKDSAHPKKCAFCTHKILEKKSGELAVKEQLRYENSEKQRFMQMENERMQGLEIEKRNMANEEQRLLEAKKRMLHYNKGWATLFRLRWFIWPIEIVIGIGFLFFSIQPSESVDTQIGLVIIFIIPTLLILSAATKMTTGMRSNIIPTAESGYAEHRAAFAILSPMIGVVIAWLIVIIWGTEILDDIAFLSCIAGGLIGIVFVLAKDTAGEFKAS